MKSADVICYKKAFFLAAWQPIHDVCACSFSSDAEVFSNNDSESLAVVVQDKRVVPVREICGNDIKFSGLGEGISIQI